MVNLWFRLFLLLLFVVVGLPKKNIVQGSSHHPCVASILSTVGSFTPTSRVTSKSTRPLNKVSTLHREREVCVTNATRAREIMYDM